MSGEKIFPFGLISLFIGIASRVFLPFPIILLIGFLFFITYFFITKEKAVFLLFPLFFIGFARSGFILVDFQKQNIEFGQDIVIEGTISEDPMIFGEYGRARIKTEKGVFVISFSDPKQYFRKDRIEIRGIIEKANQYYLNQGIKGEIKAEEVKIIDRSFFSFFTKQKNRIREIVEEKTAIPYSPIILAMILGDNYGLPEDLKESLNNSGLRHIISISGTHITIIMNLLMGLLLFLGISNRKSGIIVLLIIFLYIFFIGFYAPAIRAAIMGSSLILAQLFRRQPDPFRFLLFSGTAMLFINPFLINDPGFWLSFTATSGMIFFSNFFTEKIKKIFKNKYLSQVLGITFSAQIFSLPIILYYFGSSSIMAFFSNLLIAPIIPFIISLSFVAIIFGFIFSPIALMVFVVIQALLSYLIFISNMTSKIFPFYINFFPNIFIVLSIYLLLIMLARRVKEAEKISFLEY